MMKTFIPKQSVSPDAVRWFIIDGTERILGRIASSISTILRGKHQPTYARHVDPRIGVIVVNSTLIKVTGKKMTDKIYYRHSGHVGNLKSTALKDMIEKDPTQPLFLAVKGMMPRNKISRTMLKRLRIYEKGHDMDAQKPESITV